MEATMNKEYIYIDGKVIISDENDYKVQSEYYDNLDKVLVQENLIETMEIRLQALEKESELYKKYNRKHYKPIYFPTTALMSTIGAPIVISLLTGTNLFITPVDTIFGTISQAMAISIPISICFLPLSAGIEFDTYIDYKNSFKKEKGINSELDFLKKQIEKEKEYLESLNKKNQEIKKTLNLE